MPRRFVRIVITCALFTLGVLSLFLAASSSAADGNSVPLSSPQWHPPIDLTSYLTTSTTQVPTTTTTKLKQARPTQRAVSAPTVNGTGTVHVLSDYQYLAPCIEQHESGHTYHNNKNPRSTASGVGQWLDSTWNGYGGYGRAMDAPPELQDQRMREDLSLPLKHIQQEWAAQRGACNF